jgi:hypothetical protein
MKTETRTVMPTAKIEDFGGVGTPGGRFLRSLALPL